MSRIVGPDGPIPARIMVVGEAPGQDEEWKGVPFVGVSGQLMNSMLHEAGIMRSECFVTNVVRIRPPKNNIEAYISPLKTQPSKDHVQLLGKWVLPVVVEGYKQLQVELAAVRPNIVLALGNTPLWALTGKQGIMKWRGSMLYGPNGVKVIPSIHPAAILREMRLRASGVYDLHRAARFLSGAPYPDMRWQMTVAPTFSQTIAWLERLLDRLDERPTRVSWDLETYAGHINCSGLSYEIDAICIPFMASGTMTGYWSADEEAIVVWMIYKILTHKRVLVVGQNLLYDCQYSWRHWHFVPRVYQDTMIAQHSIWADLPKALYFQASMYASNYVYWKDEGKNWENANNEVEGWEYNCKDCLYTDEVGLKEIEYAQKLGMIKVYQEQQDMFWPVLEAMKVGVRIDTEKRSVLADQVAADIAKRQEILKEILGHSINPNSPKQMHALFYTDLQQPVQIKRGKKGEPSRPTLDDDAMQKLVLREPLLKPLVNCIADIRTLNILHSTFLTSELDIDGRMRCAFNIGGSESGKSAPKTYRLSSSENAFGGGGNLQNIPSDKSKAVGKAVARGATFGEMLRFPNIREIFIPDEGSTWFNGDLDRADLQVVVWESGDEMLKAALRMGVDIHLLNAIILENKDPPPLEELVPSHDRYVGHRAPRKLAREFAKVFVHATDYGGKSRTVAAHTGRTVHEVDRAQKLWFGAHPGIETWQKSIDTQIRKNRYVENRFGYRWYIFDRIDSILPEALAWIPQSTVSIVINRIWRKVHYNVPKAITLLQGHDALGGQFRTEDKEECCTAIMEQSQIIIPYDEPLVIPFSLTTSELSWGDCG